MGGARPPAPRQLETFFGTASNLADAPSTTVPNVIRNEEDLTSQDTGTEPATEKENCPPPDQNKEAFKPANLLSKPGGTTDDLTTLDNSEGSPHKLAPGASENSLFKQNERPQHHSIPPCPSTTKSDNIGGPVKLFKYGDPSKRRRPSQE